MGIDWTQVIISLCALVITGVIVACIKTIIANEKATLDKKTQETIEYWTETGVRWAKQWLQSESGEKKKEAVLEYLAVKFSELGLDVAEEDVDKLIEAIYEQVKEG